MVLYFCRVAPSKGRATAFFGCLYVSNMDAVEKVLVVACFLNSNPDHRGIAVNPRKDCDADVVRKLEVEVVGVCVMRVKRGLLTIGFSLERVPLSSCFPLGPFCRDVRRRCSPCGGKAENQARVLSANGLKTAYIDHNVSSRGPRLGKSGK